jgi:hypothetical protein
MGMPGSGTSAVAGVAGMLCATPQTHPLPVAQDSPSGYWEPVRLAGVNAWIMNQDAAMRCGSRCTFEHQIASDALSQAKA